MAWDTDTALERLGITAPGTPEEQADIATAMDLTERFMVQYLNREFLDDMQDVEQFFIKPVGYGVSLRRYPVTTLSVTVNGSTLSDSAYDLMPDIGILASDGFSRANEVVATYRGGYDPAALPKDLEWALWNVFDQLHGEVTGAVPSNVTATGDAPVRSMTVFDVGSVSYDTSMGAAESGSGLDVLSPANRMKDVLSWYRREIGAL